MSLFIAHLIDDDEFQKLYDSQVLLRRATYSRLWVLNTYIPTIVVLAHDLGLTRAIDLASVEYDISSKKKKDVDMSFDYIEFKDGFLYYKCTYDSMLLMNGLKDCDTKSMNISDINKKATWVAELDSFGGRQKSDGLDNFRALMFDPITQSVCRDYKLPETYHEALIYASNLLADNKYVRHIDISNNRYRTNEVVAAQFYRVLSQSYKDYMNLAKRNRKSVISMKQSAVIDLILAQNTTTDLSVFQPLLEFETKSTISTKGVIRYAA